MQTTIPPKDPTSRRSKPQAKKKKATGQSAKPGLPKPVANQKSLKEKEHPPALPVALPVAEIMLPTESTLRDNFRAVLKDLQASVAQCEEGYHRSLWLAIAGACVVASFLAKHERHWQAFCDAKVWQTRRRKPKPDKPSEALRFILLGISGGLRNKDRAKRASKWYTAVGPLIEKGVKPEDIPDAIEEAGGIETLARESAQQKKSGSREKCKPGQPPLQKRVVPKANPANAKAVKGPLRQESLSVTLKATLEGEGTRLLSTPNGSQVLLRTRIIGQKKRIYEVTVLGVKREADPE